MTHFEKYRFVAEVTFKIVANQKSSLSFSLARGVFTGCFVNFARNGTTAWKVSKHGVFSGPYFCVFSPNAGNHVPEKNSTFVHFSRSALPKSTCSKSTISTLAKMVLVSLLLALNR